MSRLTAASDITDYDIQYKKTADTVWLDLPHTGTARTATLLNVFDEDEYEFQMRGDECRGYWRMVASGTGSGIATATLYAVDDRHDNLYTVNVVTGATTLVGSMGSGNWGGLAGIGQRSLRGR